MSNVLVDVTSDPNYPLPVCHIYRLPGCMIIGVSGCLIFDRPIIPMILIVCCSSDNCW